MNVCEYKKRIVANNQAGFTLLISILITSVVLAIGLAILTITVKQFILVGISRDSTIALHAADAGLECMRYWDTSDAGGDKFDVDAPADTFNCMGLNGIPVGGAASGVQQNFQFSWGNPAVCTRTNIIKYYSTTGDVTMDNGELCPIGAECTRLETRGYNKGCADLDSPRTVERALRLRY